MFVSCFCGFRGSMVARIVHFYLWVCISVGNCSAYAFDGSDPLEQHRANIDKAVVDASRAMAIEIKGALQKKDVTRAEELSESLAGFLNNDDHPASLIIVPKVAEDFSAKRKESARIVYQHYVDQLANDPGSKKSITWEMEEFVKKETELQKLKSSNSQDANLVPPKRSGSAMMNDLPTRKSQASKSSSTSTAQKSNGTTGLLDLDKLKEINGRIEAFQQAYNQHFNGATTDLQRQRVADKYQADAVKDCLKLFEGLFIEVECELVNSTQTGNVSFPYTITIKEVDSSVELELPTKHIELSKAYAAFADAKAGSRFKVKVPVLASVDASKLRTNITGIADSVWRQTSIRLGPATQSQVERYGQCISRLPCDEPNLGNPRVEPTTGDLLGHSGKA
ncbi:MAG: hypothetical protein KGQ60_00825, partial [Planctomycetes bacterium]|nr:hypothetical protein [Planctomycetota bacterium]